MLGAFRCRRVVDDPHSLPSSAEEPSTFVAFSRAAHRAMSSSIAEVS
jgi:hypothetical protein